jgi:hypothetical protein
MMSDIVADVTLGCMSRNLRRNMSLLVATPLIATALAACSDDKPAVCDDLGDLKSAVQSIDDASVGDGFVEAATTGVAEMRNAVTAIKADASGEFSSEVTALSGTLSLAASAVTTAASDPSASTIAKVASSVKGVADAGRGLVTAVEDKC